MRKKIGILLLCIMLVISSVTIFVSGNVLSSPSDGHQFGIGTRPTGSSTTGYIKTIYDDIVMTVKNYDETETLLELPKYSSSVHIISGVKVSGKSL